MTTTWNILTVKLTPNTNVVVEVTYEYAIIESGSFANFQGDVILEGDPSNPSFIPYDELTKEDVLTWVTNSLGEEFIGKLTTKLQEDIQHSISQNTQSNLIVETGKFI